MLHTFLMIIHFFCAASIVALVLLQRGKGAEAGAGFGAGASGTVFGARGASTALSRATAILAAIFMITSLSLAYVGTRKSTPSTGLLDQFAQPSAPATTAPSGSAGTPPAATTAPVPTAPVSTAPVPAGTTPMPRAPGNAPSVPENSTAPANSPSPKPSPK
jgi:preprotein translocase subunit SecG